MRQTQQSLLQPGIVGSLYFVLFEQFVILILEINICFTHV